MKLMALILEYDLNDFATLKRYPKINRINY